MILYRKLHLMYSQILADVAVDGRSGKVSFLLIRHHAPSHFLNSLTSYFVSDLHFFVYCQTMTVLCTNSDSKASVCAGRQLGQVSRLEKRLSAMLVRSRFQEDFDDVSPVSLLDV